MHKTKALNLLRPNAQWVMHDDKLTWLDKKQNEPTKQEINKKIEEIKAIEKAELYKEKRLAEYPTLQECIHAILDDNLEELQNKRQAVKDKYPKGDK